MFRDFQFPRAARAAPLALLLSLAAFAALSLSASAETGGPTLEVDGVWRCRTTFNCTEACPRGIQVTQAIAEVKQAILSRKI